MARHLPTLLAFAPMTTTAWSVEGVCWARGHLPAAPKPFEAASIAY